MNVFKQWMGAATPQEQEVLARTIGTSRAMLHQISGGHKPVAPARAAAIERATDAMHDLSDGRLPKVYRTDLVDACRGCQYARQCLGDVALRDSLPEVTAEMMGGAR